ncbi:MAG: type II secretion system protein [Sedimentisphaerales bacterium]
MKSGKRGFTLPEVIVVLVIIALAFSISAALVPSMDRARDNARRMLCANNLRRVGAAMIMYAGTYDNLLPTNQGTPCGQTKVQVETHPYVLYRNDFRNCDKSVDPDGKLIPLRFACLFETGFITDPNLFYCPASEYSWFRYESYIDPPPWGTLPQNYNSSPGGPGNEWVRMSYTYYPTDSNAPKRTDPQTGFKYREPNCARFDRLDGTLPYATDVIWTRDTLSHKSGIRRVNNKVVVLDPGINGLFKDGHVVYCADPNVFTDNLTTPAGVVWYLKESSILANWNVFYYTIFDMIEP